MIEPYQWLQKNQTFIGTINKDSLQPASLDLHLGDSVVIMRISFNPIRWLKFFLWKRKKITNHQDLVRNNLIIRKEVSLENKGSILCLPLRLYILHSQEYIKIDHEHAALLFLRSTTGREGFSHNMAGYFDPGFEGNGVLEVTTIIPGFLHKNQRIAQLAYVKLTEKTDKPYNGKYKAQKGAQEALREKYLDKYIVGKR